MSKILFLANFLADINAGGFKYGVQSVRVDVSSGGSSTGPISGAQTGKNPLHSYQPMISISKQNKIVIIP